MNKQLVWERALKSFQFGRALKVEYSKGDYSPCACLGAMAVSLLYIGDIFWYSLLKPEIAMLNIVFVTLFKQDIVCIVSLAIKEF